MAKKATKQTKKQSKSTKKTNDKKEVTKRTKTLLTILFVLFAILAILLIVKNYATEEKTIIQYPGIDNTSTQEANNGVKFSSEIDISTKEDTKIALPKEISENNIAQIECLIDGIPILYQPKEITTKSIIIDATDIESSMEVGNIYSCRLLTCRIESEESIIMSCMKDSNIIDNQQFILNVVE